MNKKIILKFDKKIEENLLVDLIISILKDLSNRKLFFYLDDVLKDNYNYYFVFSGNIKKYNLLIENIGVYTKFENFLLST